MRIRLVIAVAILFAQVISVGYAHFGPAPDGQSWVRKTLDGCSAQPVGCRRYFAWAPNDYRVQYALSVVLARRRLSRADALRRYHLPPPTATGNSYWEDPPQRLLDTIETFERSHPTSGVRVLVTYRINGGRKHGWRWRGV